MSTTPTYITVDPNSPAFLVYHDHSYFIRHESTHPPTETSHRRKASTSTVTNNSTTTPITTVKHSHSQSSANGSLPSVQVLNQLLLQHQQRSQLSTSVTSSSPTPADLAAILRALLNKQAHHLPAPLSKDPPDTNVPDATSPLPSSTAAS